MLKRVISAASTGFAALCLIVSPALHAAEPDEKVLADIDQVFEQWRVSSNVPGLVYGIVKDGRLVAVNGLGIQDVTAKRPVNSDTLFRIASMSKAFTALAILKLRDQRKLSLDAPAENYVPEMRNWIYPTKDSRKIRVRDLLNHVAGFVTDDPWGDRQQPLAEAEFTAMLKVGVPFSRTAGVAMEYSNFGYATLGRVITNVSGKRYQDYISDNFLSPLGMSSTTYDIAKSPIGRRAIGYRWQDDSWVREPDMADGVFGAMGGIETSANDYARWVGMLLSAWPPRDAPDTGPVSRATLREIVEGSNFPMASMRAAEVGTPCRVARTYAMGWYIMDDCDLGRVLTHGGGYPGYGSRVLLLPDKGIGIFALSNKTYAGPSVPVLKAALALVATLKFPDRQAPVSSGVAKGYEFARTIWAAGNISDAKAEVSINFLMDRDEQHWKYDMAKLKSQVGACPAIEAVTAKAAMEGAFVWTCEHGRIQGGFLLAPTNKVTLQALKFEVAKP